MGLIILVIIVLTLIYNANNFVTRNVMNKFGNRTIRFCGTYETYDFAMKCVDSLVKIYIPSFIMLGLNIKVVLRLRQSKKRSLAGQGVSKSNVNKFAVSTILIDLFFFIFKSPEAFLNVYIFFINGQLIGVIWNIMDIFNDFSLNFSFLFIFIFVIFNRLFRQELIYFLNFGHLSSILSNRLIS